MKPLSKTKELISEAQNHEGKIRELGQKLEEIVKTKTSAMQRQRYEESAKLRAEELALIKELESLLSK